MQKTKAKKQGFVISSMLDIKTNKYLLVISSSFYNLLNINLHISNYTNQQKEIGFIFMAMNPQKPALRPDRKFWRWKSGSFDMYVNVPDYEKFCNATHKEAKKIIAKLYLASIKKYLWKRKDFDAPKFYKDVKEVFKPILNS